MTRASGIVCGGFTVWLAAALGLPSAACAGTGVQYSLDRSSTLVSKDVGPERWAITYRIADGETFGSVFYPDGRAPSFVSCKRQSVNGGDGTFSCSGADACAVEPCPITQYRFIDDVTLALSFFFPPTDDVVPDVSGSYDVSGISQLSSSCDARIGSILTSALQQQGNCVFTVNHVGAVVTIQSGCGITYQGSATPGGVIQATARRVTVDGACTTTADMEMSADASQDLSSLALGVRLGFSEGCVFAGTSERIPDCEGAGEGLWVRIPG